MYVYVGGSFMVPVKVRRQLEEISCLLLPLCRFWVPNSDSPSRLMYQALSQLRHLVALILITDNF